MILANIPMYWKRYQADQSAGKQYFKLLPGLKDALLTRNETHNWDDWSSAWFWMVMYFSFAVWSSTQGHFDDPWAAGEQNIKSHSRSSTCHLQRLRCKLIILT